MRTVSTGRWDDLSLGEGLSDRWTCLLSGGTLTLGWGFLTAEKFPRYTLETQDI